MPPFISFSTSYPELPPMPKCMTRRLLWCANDLVGDLSASGAFPPKIRAPHPHKSPDRLNGDRGLFYRHPLELGGVGNWLPR